MCMRTRHKYINNYTTKQHTAGSEWREVEELLRAETEMRQEGLSTEKSDEFYSCDQNWLPRKVQEGLIFSGRQGSRKTLT